MTSSLFWAGVSPPANYEWIKINFSCSDMQSIQWSGVTLCLFLLCQSLTWLVCWEQLIAASNEIVFLPSIAIGLAVCLFIFWNKGFFAPILHSWFMFLTLCLTHNGSHSHVAQFFISATKLATKLSIWVWMFSKPRLKLGKQIGVQPLFLKICWLFLGHFDS